jgi:hypothetical protein
VRIFNVLWRQFIDASKMSLRSVLRMKCEYIILSRANAPVHVVVSEGSNFSPFKVSMTFTIFINFKIIVFSFKRWKY